MNPFNAPEEKTHAFSPIQRVIRIVLMLSCFTVARAPATELIHWQSANLQILHGEHYKAGASRREIVSGEYANGWTYGDFFVFADYVFPQSQPSSYYVEPTLRLSCTKIFDRSCAKGRALDFYFSINIEKPKGQELRSLLGVSTDIKLAGFKFFKPTMSWRDNPTLSGSTYQLTLVWNRPFVWLKQHFMFEGFVDFAGREGAAERNFLMAPRALLDAGKTIGLTPNKLWLGLEWQYWHNKFGIRGITESVPQWQLKWVL